MDRGAVIGGVMLGVSLVLALAFNINAARHPASATTVLPVQVIEPAADLKREDTYTNPHDSERLAPPSER